MCWSQWSTSSWACHCATYRLIIQGHGCCSFWQNQNPKSIFPLVAIYGRRTAKASRSAFWLITRSIVPLQTFLIITFKLSLTNFCLPTQGCHISVTTLLWEGVGIQGLPDTSYSASVSSNKGRQSLPPGTLALLTGPTDLMVTQTTKVNKNKGWSTKRHLSRVCSELNTSL